MYTTLNSIKIYGGDKYCPRGWNALLNYFHKTEPDDTPIHFYILIDIIGLFGSIWCLRTIDGHEDKKHEFLEFCVQQHTHEEMIEKFLDLFGN